MELAAEVMHSVEERLASLAALLHVGEVVQLEKVSGAVSVPGIPEIMEHVVPVIEPESRDARVAPERKGGKVVVKRRETPAAQRVRMRMIASLVDRIRQPA